MQQFLQSQIEFMILFQSLGDWLSDPMLFFTFLGEETFFLLVMPLLLWNYDARLGVRLGYILLVGSAVNAIFKLIFASPRPYWISDRIIGLRTESSFGLPSGHAWTAAALWGRLAIAVRHRAVALVLVGIIFMVGLSRIYLGVHFPSDVLFGWMGGLGILLVFLAAERRIEPALERAPLYAAIASLLLLSIVLIAVGFIVIGPTGSEALPVEWETRIRSIDPDGSFDPWNMEGVISVSGALFGLGAGSQLLFRGREYQARGSIREMIGRYLIGVIGVALLFYGLASLIPEGTSAVHLFARYLRYGLVGFWISFGAPRVFQRLNLA